MLEDVNNVSPIVSPVVNKERNLISPFATLLLVVGCFLQWIQNNKNNYSDANSYKYPVGEIFVNMPYSKNEDVVMKGDR